MANVVFKRGLQASLDSLTTIEDGVFYLTQDTNRLYIGKENNNKQLLNQTVTIVDTVTALNALSSSWTTPQAQLDHKEDFVYIDELNILAVWTFDHDQNKYDWVQINQDTNTYLGSHSFSSSATGTNTVNTTLTSTLSGNRMSGTTAVASFAVEGDSGILVSAATATNGVLISGNQYSLSTSFDSLAEEATITLGSNNLSTTSGFSIAAGTNVSLSTTGTDGIVISSINDYVNSATLGVSSTTAGLVELTLTRVRGGTVSATANLGVAVGTANNSYAPLINTAGKTAATIYTKDEIDNLLNGLDGMTYKGTITKSGNGGTINSLPTTSTTSDALVIASICPCNAVSAFCLAVVSVPTALLIALFISPVFV